MSSTGLLLVILAVFIIFNSDKLAWVFMGKLKFNHSDPNADHAPPK